MRLSAEALAACEEFHRTPVASVLRDPRPAVQVTAEEWAAVEAGYRARFVALGVAWQAAAAIALATRPVPQLPTRTSVRLLGGGTTEQRRAAARRARPC